MTNLIIIYIKYNVYNIIYQLLFHLIQKLTLLCSYDNIIKDTSFLKCYNRCVKRNKND